jgi:hypothetical protein
MKKGDILDTTFGQYRVDGFGEHGVRGRWLTGTLAGRDACVEKSALREMVEKGRRMAEVLATQERP